MQQSRIFVGMVLILIFGEVLGLYGYANHGGPTTITGWLTIRQIDCCPDSQHESSGLDDSPKVGMEQTLLHY